MGGACHVMARRGFKDYEEGPNHTPRHPEGRPEDRPLSCLRIVLNASARLLRSQRHRGRRVAGLRRQGPVGIGSHTHRMVLSCFLAVALVQSRVAIVMAPVRAAEIGHIGAALAPSDPVSGIVFASDRDDEQKSRLRTSDLYVLDANGSVKRITHDEVGLGGYSSPNWSPDGARIVAIRRAGSTTSIVVMDADGSNERQFNDLSESHANWTAWSHDGADIAYDGHDYPGIKLVRSDGTNQRLIRPPISSQGFLGHPSWSPDGQKIAFSYDGPMVNGLPNWRRVAVINIDGSGFYDVTHGEHPDTADDPAWSPDGTVLAVSLHAGANFAGRFGTCSETLALVAIDGKTLPRDLPKVGCSNHGPSWSSDGSHIVFVAPADPSSHPGWGDDLYVMRRDGSGVTRLTDNGAPSDEDPSYNGVADPLPETPGTRYQVITSPARRVIRVLAVGSVVVAVGLLAVAGRRRRREG